MQHVDFATLALLVNPASLIFGKGLELTDLSLLPGEDVSADLKSSSVSRSSYATLHGTAKIGIARELDWGKAIVRPYITFTDGTTKARINLGAYFMNAPERDAEEEPVVYDVQCVDILDILRDSVGDSYSVPAGTSYLDAVKVILDSRGVQFPIIDNTAASAVLPTARSWPFDDRITWLSIVNDLLASIGYQGIFSDWDGHLVVQPYVSPRMRPSEWIYNDSPTQGMLARKRSIKRNFTDAPNRWVFYQTNNSGGPAPVEGAGIYSYVNEFIGDTSVAARGRIITRPVGLDVADHASLVAAAQITIDADMQVPQVIKAQTFPNPFHWHFDRMTVDDPRLGPRMEVVGTTWTLNLAPTNTMTHEWTVL